MAELATGQDGIVERRELLALGLSAAAIDHRVRAGRLIVLYRGVYAVGHRAPSERATLRAGLIAAGPTASHSHLTSAARLKLTPSMPPFVEVTVTRKGPRSRPGLKIHETTRPPDVWILDGLPLTAPLRTLADLAASPDIERMCAQALVLKLLTEEELDAAGILGPELIAPTRSEFERRFRATLRKAGLPPRARRLPRGAWLGRPPRHVAEAPKRADAGDDAARPDARAPRVNAGSRQQSGARPALTAYIAVAAGMAAEP